MNPYTLQSHEALARWDEIAPYLNRIEVVDTPLSHVRAMIATREAQVWCYGEPIECVLLTKIENTREYRYGLLWKCAGDLPVNYAQFVTAIENWFRSMDCKHVQIIGRRGWKKMFPDYHEQSVNLVKQL